MASTRQPFWTGSKKQFRRKKEMPGIGQENGGISPRSFKRHRPAKNDRIAIWNPTASTAFAWFGSLRLPPVPEAQNNHGWREILVEWRGARGSERLFSGPWRKSLPGGNQHDGDTLDQVYWASKALCRKIKYNLKQFYIVFIVIPETFQSTLIPDPSGCCAHIFNRLVHIDLKV